MNLIKIQENPKIGKYGKPKHCIQRYQPVKITANNYLLRVERKRLAVTSLAII